VLAVLGSMIIFSARAPDISSARFGFNLPPSHLEHLLRLLILRSTYSSLLSYRLSRISQIDQKCNSNDWCDNYSNLQKQHIKKPYIDAC
jgi:hypothetical protein